MLLGIDVLARLRNSAETLDSLTSVLPGHSAERVEAVLDLLAKQGFVSSAPGGYQGDPSSFVTVYTVTPEGEKAYARVLDRWATELMGPPTMTVVERFLLALAGEASELQRESLLALLDRVSAAPADSGERSRALDLARAAFIWAQRALDADEHAAAYAAGARSLPTWDAEDLGAVALQLRDSYASKVRDTALRSVVEAAAQSAEAAWELRLLAARDEDGISRERTVDPSAYFEVAERAAQTLRGLASAAAADVVAEATAVVEALYPAAGMGTPDG